VFRGPRAAGKRRTGTGLLALGERFFEALSRKPGETMAVLSAEVGASPVELQRIRPVKDGLELRG